VVFPQELSAHFGSELHERNMGLLRSRLALPALWAMVCTYSPVSGRQLLRPLKLVRVPAEGLQVTVVEQDRFLFRAPDNLADSHPAESSMNPNAANPVSLL
jgi:hypothetical protein